ncbi:unnamed protein product [Soboliphyme baturini]|uniref:Phosphoenolpyruvate synthase n=1 Tax=Soboliphyme baturini TaxID=241478 RepID=A0A183IPA3_9BILA|nr:unnamed protein product [Soboliphyme baturini]
MTNSRPHQANILKTPLEMTIWEAGRQFRDTIENVPPRLLTLRTDDVEFVTIMQTSSSRVGFDSIVMPFTVNQSYMSHAG